MRKTSRTASAIVGMAALLVLSFTPMLALSTNVYAHAEAGAEQNETTTATTTDDTASENDTKPTAGERRAAAQTKLDSAKLRACQNRKQAISNIMSHIADRGQRQLDLFNTIAMRVETFYTNKGKTLSNYDTLVADVNAKKAAAQTTVDAIKSASANFSCDGSDPKGFVTSFKDSLKDEIAALKAYRTAVKNLIVGVKSVQGSTTSDANQTNEGENQ